MKTLKKLLFFFLMGSMAITACNPDDDTPTENKPTVDISPSKATANPGETVTLTIVAGAQEELKDLKVTVSVNNSSVSTVLDSTFANNRTNSTVTYNYTVGNAGSYVFTATVTDKKGNSVNDQTTVTVSGTSDLQLCGNVTLGSYQSTTGSFFSSSDCGVYTVSTAKNNQSKVDFIYFYGASNAATIAAPDDADVNTISTFQLGDWSTKNATKFKKLSGYDFNTATSANVAVAYLAAGGEASKANNLAVGDVVGFLTAGGKYGVARVKTISGAQSGTITLDVKTQK